MKSSALSFLCLPRCPHRNNCYGIQFFVQLEIKGFESMRIYLIAFTASIHNENHCPTRICTIFRCDANFCYFMENGGSGCIILFNLLLTVHVTNNIVLAILSTLLKILIVNFNPGKLNFWVTCPDGQVEVNS